LQSSMFGRFVAWSLFWRPWPKPSPAFIGADKGCVSERRSPCWGRCCGHQIHLVSSGEDLVYSFVGM
jgi:hypothetical protein